MLQENFTTSLKTACGLPSEMGLECSSYINGEVVVKVRCGRYFGGVSCYE